MEEGSSANSARQSVDGDTSASKQGAHKRYSSIWQTISKKGNTGRTYKFAKCCATVYEIRKDKKTPGDPESNEGNYFHPSDQTDTLVNFLGKRSTWNENLLAEKLKKAEENCGAGAEANYNLDHATAQRNIQFNSLKIRLGALEREFADYRNEARLNSDMLHSMVQSLEAKNSVLEKSIKDEIHHREVAVSSMRSLLFCMDQLCDPCRQKVSITRSSKPEEICSK